MQTRPSAWMSSNVYMYLVQFQIHTSRSYCHVTWAFDHMLPKLLFFTTDCFRAMHKVVVPKSSGVHRFACMVSLAYQNLRHADGTF